MTTRSQRSSSRPWSSSSSDWPTRSAARTAVFAYLENWYNPKPRHSTLGYLGPAAYEAQLLVAA